jgi:hypothetical protein
VAVDYPHDFPAKSSAKVEAAKIKGSRQFDSSRTKARSNREIKELFWTYVLTPFLVFAEESFRLRLWSADKIDQKCREFLRHCAIEAYYQKGKAAGLSEIISNWNGSILQEAQNEIEKTPEWRKYEDIFLRFEVQGSPPAQHSTKIVLSGKGHKASSKKTNEKVRAVADLAKKLEPLMKQMPKSKRSLDKTFESLLKAEGFTDPRDIAFICASNTPNAAAAKILARWKGGSPRTLQNAVSKARPVKAR